MLELEQDSRTGNLPKPYSSNYLWKPESEECTPPTAGSSGEPSKYRCNNCNLEAPLEELRVIANAGQYNLIYPGHKSGSRNLSRIVMYRDMLLCGPCRKLFHSWLAYYPSLNHGRRQQREFSGCFPLTQFAGTFGQVRISDWGKHYWKQRFRERSQKESGRVPLPRRQVPHSPETCQTSPTSQDLR